jgi:quinol monooxygenase YgiN
MTDREPSLESQPVVVLVEWPTHDLDLDAALRLAVESDKAFRRIPGLLEARFLGDFETGTHYYLLTWRDRAASDAYLQSEQMFSIRTIAEPYVAGRPSRRVMVDYSPGRIGG